MVIKFIRFLAVFIFCIPVLAITAIHVVAEFFIFRYYCLEMEMFRDFGDEDGMNKMASMAVDALSISPKQARMLNEAAGKEVVTITTTRK
jgi:hypothetical protein